MMKDDNEIYLKRGERFKEAVKYLQENGHAKTQKDLSLSIGCSTSQISNAIKGKKTSMTKQLVWKLNKKYDNIFSEDYIWEGTGTLIDRKVDSILQMVSKTPVPYYIYKERIDELKKQQEEQKELYETIIQKMKDDISALRKDVKQLLKQK